MVIRNGMYSHSEHLTFSNLGKHSETGCTLIVPAGKYIPRLGDRILAGIGPKQVDWEFFTPGNVRGLGELSYVTAMYFAGKIHHYEAGSDRNR